MTKPKDNKSQVLAFVGSGRRNRKNQETTPSSKEIKSINKENKPQEVQKTTAKSPKDSSKEKKLRKKQVGLVITPELYERARYTAWAQKKSLNSFIFDLLDKNSVPLEEVSEH